MLKFPKQSTTYFFPIKIGSIFKQLTTQLCLAFAQAPILMKFIICAKFSYKPTSLLIAAKNF